MFTDCTLENFKEYYPYIAEGDWRLIVDTFIDSHFNEFNDYVQTVTIFSEVLEDTDTVELI